MNGLKIFLVGFFLCVHAFAREAQVVMRANGADAISYQAYLAAFPEKIAYSQWWIRHRVSTEAAESLKNHLLQAQTEFLQGGLVAARQKFTALLELSSSHDWRSAERATFVYAQLRSAQLALDQDSREQHLQQAARWGSVEVQAHLFPGPLWQDYQRFKKTRWRETLALDLWFPGARYLLVDGRPIEILAATQVEMDQMSHRFTLVYDHAVAETRIGTWNELKAWQPAVQQFASGSCEQPLWLKNPSRLDVMVYFNETCLLPWAKSQRSSLMEPQTSSARLASLPMPNLKPENTSTIAKWAWIAVGAATLAYVVHTSQEHEKKPQASTTVGF